jgi:hypothetical protein
MILFAALLLPLGGRERATSRSTLQVVAPPDGLAERG